ncbi:MAG: hypothetical protein COU85_02640 [Candidatus Portnoybacteria bacterium CG10_big_fil_rev_8_21_14_0_10_44_7]|uniref:Type II secretion system protein GspG C-terminal domain-containing protein n=1 Tax=Candidatus Portnoybacteria bacterium CG10_big_fil_rev_8_21_14_0_10_44_7 TaxID=1974816 RepID=A0A2M8KI77_9BACT|nr:MAG: hypothetical protein COU85_02640 [Candidatus Portnoybacteria bacterium CG10_big_fil_rev_8_21_14_0_10_44_7]
MKKNRGFTLIELLVVIAIIGLLASIVLVSLNSARTRARDAKAQSDLRQIATAMELYYDSNSAYYDTGASAVGAAIGSGKSISTFLPVVPYHNGDSTSGLYYWFNPTDTQHFCVYVQSDFSTSNYYYVSETGSGTGTAAGC